jgi:hypothetical protein
MGRAWRRASLVLIAAHDVFIYGDNGNGNGARATGQQRRSINQLQWHWGSGAGATAIAMGQWFYTEAQNVETGQQGDGGDRSQLQWPWGKRTGAMAMALGHRNRGNRTVIAMAMGQRWIVFLSKCNVYVLFRGSMSCIVVVENVQNVWTAIISEVVPVNKTCMIWSVLGNGPNEIYSGH